MSIHTDEPQSTHEPSHALRNLRTEATAADAFAETLLPWSGKKRVIILVGLLALVMAALAPPRSNGGTGSTSPDSASTAPQDAWRNERPAGQRADREKAV